MTDKTTIGYTKSPMGKLDISKMLKDEISKSSSIYKDPNEPFEVWFNRKIKEQNEGTDEQGMNRKEDTQNPNPSFL